MPTLNNHDLIARAQLAIVQDFDKGIMGFIRECSPDKWIDCDAKEIAQHVISCGPEAQVHELWMSFPGGFPLFLDIRDRVTADATEESQGSSIDWISVTMADQILRDAER